MSPPSDESTSTPRDPSEGDEASIAPMTSEAASAQTQAHDSDASGEHHPQMHMGHVPETGVMMRVREWIDVFPWARLARVLRLAASPTCFLLVFGVGTIWQVGMGWIDDHGLLVNRPSALDSTSDAPTRLSHSMAWMTFVTNVGWLHNPVSNLYANRSLVVGLLTFVWTAFCWTTPMLMLARQGALLTADRTLMGFPEVFQHAVRRTPLAWLAMIIPLLCVLPFLFVVWVTGLFQSWTGNTQILGSVFATISAFLLIPVGILVLGSLVAVPIALASITNEQHADPLDALSRGYEALLRRPISLLVSLGFALGCLIPIATLVTWMATAAGWVALPILPEFPLTGSVPSGMESAPIDPMVSGPVPTGMTRTLLETLHFFPACVSFAVSWGMIGGIYLLVRRATGGQEVEDIWIPSTSPAPRLPELPPTD